ncbi:methionyl-tRNA formyltransferase [Ectothiorhodospira marina]|uniref:Methionyl-tRNA formyltransferase n=1 Tax=Ectothiorhodospira marina TaxID=1396821 RepID=A0A1H7ICR2_9GAMM|nr:formyltransferase family protein [Ectothiorhodospira marina]SEK59527.1 methionyl-tRNA formyltransferase [Ectothiorhodospira marina]
MRILFIGAVEFSACALRELIEMRADVVGVCTLLESIFNADHVDLTPIAEEAGIPVCSTMDINGEEALNWIRRCEPDVIFCFGWSKLVRSPLLELPRLGVVGFHPAALPENRGRHPLIWALVLGLEETASTFFFMDEGADSGDLLSQRKIAIEPEDDARTLYTRVTEVAMGQIREFVPLLESGRYQPQPQEHSKANVWRKRGITDGRIDWRMSAETIHNLVRGLTRPYVGAHFDFGKHSVKVWRTEIGLDIAANLEPGKVLAAEEEGLLVKAGIGAIRLLEYEPRISLTPGDYL